MNKVFSKLKTIICLIYILQSCNMNKEPVNTIVNLKGVTEIQIVSFDPKYDKEIRLKLQKEEEINVFLSTFTPSINNNKTTIIKKAQFVKDGEIRVFANRDTIITIDLDFDKGYRVRINGTDYYEQFTYRTGRFIAESL